VPIPPPVGYSHIRLTVTDIARSRDFYERVFGFDVAYEAPPEDADQATKDALGFLFGGVIYAFGDGNLLGLRPVAASGDNFDEDRVGLDHLAFRLAKRADLDAAVALLDELGFAHEDPKDLGMMWILEFRDPDGVALELTAPKS
jgi:glyoxylase I family protein